MDTQIPASGSPTPEALLGMLSKLKRTLTRDLSEQRRSSSDKGYISAAIPGNPDRNGAPKLLRPSPGLDFLAEKTALSDGAAERPRSPVAAALELESAAPPMDLDRSSRLGSSPVPRLPLPNLSIYTLPPFESSESAQGTFNPEDSRGRDGSVKLAASPADASAAQVADLPGKDRPSKPIAIAENATSASNDLERGRKACGTPSAEVLPLPGTRDETVWSAKTDVVTESEAANADTKSSGPPQGPQEQQEWPVKGHQEVVQADAEGQLSGPTPMPVTEEGLDIAMEELSLEVSQLQPSTSALVSQGSYLQRHTSSLIIKMSQDAAMPPLPAVAHMGAAARSEASSPQVVTPSHGAKLSDPQKTIKSMAASLFRAFDEGRLKERAPAPAATSGASAQAEHTLAATLRTYRSLPPKRREASTPPPARTSSYASRQQASLRRSLSPHARQQTSATRKRPEWDASRPSQPTPERAKRAADVLNQAIATGVHLNSQPSPQRAQPAVAGLPNFQTDGHLGAKHAQHAALRPELPGGLQAESAGQPRVRSRISESGAAASHVMSGSSHQAAGIGATRLPLETPNSSAAQPALVSDHGVPNTSLRGQAGKGQLSPTPSPPRFRRLPSNSLLDRPAWASPTQPRATAAAVPSQASSLRRSAGSRTVTASNERMQRQTATGSRQMEGDVAGNSAAGAQPAVQGVNLAADSDTDTPGQEDSQASANSHADYLTDTHAHAHAQILQQLQQAVEEYQSSSPHVLVPAAIELTAALRQAAKRPGQLRQSVEDLQLAGLKLKHEAGDSPCTDMPMSPWPAWVKGAWGSPQAPGGVPPALPGVPGKQTQGAAAAMPCDSAGVVGVNAPAVTKDIAPQRAQHELRPGRAAAPQAAWSPMKKTESASSSRDRLVRRALAEAEAAAAKNPSDYPRRPRGRSQDKPSGAAAGRTRTFATPPRPLIKPSRASATPPRAAITPPRTANPSLPVLPASDKARQHNSLHAALGQASNLVKRPSVKRGHSGGSRKRSWQPTSAAPHPFKGHPEPEVPIVQGRQAQSAHQGRPVHREASSLQTQQRASALEAFGIAPSAQHTNAVQSHCVRLTSEDAEESLQPEANDANQHLTSNLDSGPSAHAALAPAHSMTSVAALRQCFEQHGSPTVGLIDSVKPRNRLPLRKVSSKAHVVTDDRSPQQAALLWQQSLRGEPDGEDLAVEHQAETHAESDKADHGSGGRQSHAGHLAGRHEHAGMAGDANTNVPHLYHTMSALVSQRQASPRVSVTGMPIRASVGTAASLADQSHSVSPVRLTEALLAAAGDVTSSAEKLPVSHRLPVSRSVFDSDEGSLVSSDEEVTISNKGIASAHPQGCQAQSLTEEATLALLPDRGMSPVSESSGDQAAAGSGQRRESESARPAGLSGPQHAQHMSLSYTDTRHEVYPWRALAWAHGHSWFRIICKLLPSPPPHFAHPLGPHLLQTSLGLHGADAKNYAFDQVLLEDCSEADVAEQASGVVEAVLQGRNSLVLALGQAGSGKSHTMLGSALHNVDASSSTGLSTILVKSLFLKIQQRRLPAEVHSVYVTAFQIMNETIQDLLQIREAEAEVKQNHKRGGSASDRHDVFVDKQKRTWVSNLAAFQISSPADFANMLSLISGRRHQSSSSHPHKYMSHAPSSCVITLLVTADVPTASVPSSARRRNSNPQSGATQSQGLPAMTRVCSKLSFIEVGSRAVASTAGPMRTVSAGPLHHQLSTISTSVSTVSSYARCSSMGDRRQNVPSGNSPISNGAADSRSMGRGKAQDSTMRSVSEVVWAAAHGKGVPVPNRACKLTRYLQDTLCPSGRAVGIMCVDPATSAQTVGMPTLAASERMMPSQA